MISISDTLKNAYLSSTVQVDRILLNGNYYRVTDVELNDDCYLDGNIFGTAIAKTLSFNIEIGIDVENKDFKYETGLLINDQYEWVSLGSFIVQDVEPNETTGINKVTAIDYMLKTNIEYKTSLNYESKLITLLDVLNEVCVNSGLILATTNFDNKNFIVDSNQFEEGTINRDVIKAIAEITGTVAKIKSDDKLYLINPNEQTVKKQITSNVYSEIEIKRYTQPINEVVLGMKDVEGENVVLKDEASIAINGENIIRFDDNPFAYTQNKREQLITALFNAIKGFEYKAFSMKCQMQPYLEAMDKIEIKVNNDVFESYVFRFTNKSPNGLESTVEAPSIIKATVEYENTLDAIDRAKRTEIIVDKQNQKIEEVIELANDSSSKVAKVEQTVDEIKQEIGNITDITTTLKGQGVLVGTGINISEPIKLRIHPIGYDITPLYPSDTLFPSSTLYPHSREFLIHQTAYSKEEDKQDDIVYNLPCNLYYLDEETYDEFIMNYEEQHCYVIHKIELDENLNKVKKEINVIEYFDYPKFSLNNGNYEFSMPAFFTAYMEITLMLQNIYTSQFATRVELKSQITQSAEEINENVDKKIYETNGAIKELSSQVIINFDSITNLSQETKQNGNNITTLNTKIKQTPKKVTITANDNNTSAGIVIKLFDENGNQISSDDANITLSGLVKFTDLSQSGGSTIINGDKIKTGTIDGERLNVTKLNATEGTIAGISVGNTGLFYSGQSNYDGFGLWRAGVHSTNTPAGDYSSIIFHSGGDITNVGNANFRVYENGCVYAKQLYTNENYIFVKTRSVNTTEISTNGSTAWFEIGTYRGSAYGITVNQSDENLKENMKKCDLSALDVLNQIEHYEFDWKSSGEHEKCGFKAQQLKKVNENFVFAVKQPQGAELEEILQVNDFNILPFVTKSVQELYKENVELKSEVKELSEENKKMKEQINQILKRLEELENVSMDK